MEGATTPRHDLHHNPSRGRSDSRRGDCQNTWDTPTLDCRTMVAPRRTSPTTVTTATVTTLVGDSEHSYPQISPNTSPGYNTDDRATQDLNIIDNVEAQNNIATREESSDSDLSAVESSANNTSDELNTTSFLGGDVLLPSVGEAGTAVEELDVGSSAESLDEAALQNPDTDEAGTCFFEDTESWSDLPRSSKVSFHDAGSTDAGSLTDVAQAYQGEDILDSCGSPEDADDGMNSITAEESATCQMDPLLCEQFQLANNDIARQQKAMGKKDGEEGIIAEVGPTKSDNDDYDVNANVNGNDHNALQILSTKTNNEDDTEALRDEQASLPSSELHQTMHSSQQADEQQGEDEEDHNDEEMNSPSNPSSTVENSNNNNRAYIGAFRVFPGEMRAERVGPAPAELPVASQGNNLNHDDDIDLETGREINTANDNDVDDASVIPMLEAALVDDRIVEAHPIHLTHVPISSMDQQEKVSERKIPILGRVLIAICVILAASVGAYLGTKDKNNGTTDTLISNTGDDLPIASQDTEPAAIGETLNGTAGTLIGSQSEEEVANNTREDLPIASQDTAPPAIGETLVSSNATAFATIETANDVTPIIWEQIGSTIPGVSKRNRAGIAVASSNDGKIIAIGSSLNDDVAEDAGHVRIFAWNHTANDWVQRGSTMLGQMEGDTFGFRVAMSGSGDVVACGAPLHDTDDSGQVKVFRWNETLADYVAWGSLHILKRNVWELWGWDVALSEDGSRVAVGAPGDDWDDDGYNFAEAKVFEWNATIMDWSLMGKDWFSLDSQQLGNDFGHSVSLSADGGTLAVGAIKHNGTSGEAGKTCVLKWDDVVSDWVQLGSDIYGEAAGDSSGWRTDLSADGKTVAISALTNGGVNGRESGHVRVYYWDELLSDWAQMGSDIDGIEQFDRFGVELSLANDGKRIAITSVLNSDNGLRSGHCRVFQWSDSTQCWIQVGQVIQGEEEDGTRGVALSGDGRTLVVGAPSASRSTGYVRVFNSSQWEEGDHDLFN